MECVVCCVHAPWYSKMVAPLRPVVDCGVLKGSGSCALIKPPKSPNSASCNNAGWLLPAKTDLCSSDSFSGRFPRKKCGFVGARLRFPRQSWIHRIRRDFLKVMMATADQDGNGDEESSEELETTTPPLAITESRWLVASSDFWLQVAIFVFAAGFIDASFSGDWSRIGILSKETEGDLQMAAIGVVPLAGTLIWSISQRRKSS